MFCPAQRPQAPGVPHLNQLPGLGAPSIRSLIADGWDWIAATSVVSPKFVPPKAVILSVVRRVFCA